MAMQPGEVKRELVCDPETGLRRWMETRMLPGDPRPAEPTDRWLKSRLEIRSTRAVVEGETFEEAAGRSFAFSEAAKRDRRYKMHTSGTWRPIPGSHMSIYEYEYPDGSTGWFEWYYVPVPAAELRGEGPR